MQKIKIQNFFPILEQSLFYFGCICLFMPTTIHKSTQLAWFTIAIVIALIKNVRKNKTQSQNV